MARHKLWDMRVVRISSVAPVHTRLRDLLFHPSSTLCSEHPLGRVLPTLRPQWALPGSAHSCSDSSVSISGVKVHSIVSTPVGTGFPF